MHHIGGKGKFGGMFFVNGGGKRDDGGFVGRTDAKSQALVGVYVLCGGWLAGAEPEEGVEEEIVLVGGGEGGRFAEVGFVVHEVAAEVGVDHFEVFVGPDDGEVAVVP